MNNWYVLFIEFVITASLSIDIVVSAIIAAIRLHKKKKTKPAVISLLQTLLRSYAWLCFYAHISIITNTTIGS